MSITQCLRELANEFDYVVKADIGDCGVDKVSDLVDDSVSYQKQHTWSWFVPSIETEVDRDRTKFEQVEDVKSCRESKIQRDMEMISMRRKD